MTAIGSPVALTARADEIFRELREGNFRRTDQLFSVLLVLQWVGAVIGAGILSLRTPSPTVSGLDPRISFALLGGGTLCLIPWLLARRRPGERATRYCIAISQILFTSLLIQVSGVRTGTHFHVFGSLALLAAYRDRPLLALSTIVAVADPLARSLSADSVPGAGLSWIEPAAWLLFVFVILLIPIIQSLSDMREMSLRTAELEASHARVKRQTEDLHSAFQREHAIIEGALDAVVGMNEEGAVVAWNSQAERTFGWSREEAMGRRLADLIIPPEFRVMHNAGVVMYLRTGNGPAMNRRLELTGLHRSGRTFPVELSITPIRLGHETTFCAFVRDITERKAAEDALRRSDAHARRLALVAARTDNAVIITDTQGRIEWVNEGFTRITGYTADEAFGQKPGALLQGPETDPETVAYMRGRIEANEPFEVEILNYSKTGREYWVAVEVQPLWDATGVPTGFMAVESDITHRKASEQELRRAKDDAESANRAKSEFLANISHEIRTPLTGILGFADVLRREEISARQARSYLDIIHSSGTHLLTLINDILDLSKIEAGRMEFDRNRCSPHQIIADVLSVLRVRAQEKGLSLECCWTTSTPEFIESDPARLRQLLMNLVGNAIKFTDRGLVSVEAAYDAQTPEPRLAISVRDTGIGIAADHLDRIFLPFDQADNSITRRFGGTGLGLAISRHIARGLGGDISVSSLAGHGSTFRVTLATGCADDVVLIPATSGDSVQPRSAEPALKSVEPVDLSARRILLVEDGETNRDLISLVLGRAGADVMCAENGREGVELAERERFDLILMDMQMPVMDGYSAAAALRAGGCRAPIIALTAHAMRGDREKCLAAGCTGYLTKPIQIDRLLETVAAEIASKPRSMSDSVEWGDDELARAASDRVLSTLPTDIPKFRAIVEGFVETLARRRRDMQSALDEERWADLALEAHWLKGAGGTVGFDCLTEPAARLEQNARRGHAHDARNCLKELDCLIERIAISEALGV
ncbi:MAG: PAS domain S-box protein [Planctomyces sp.]|nr:PAS domain S-box protein [Planctomyces sp.]